MDSPNNYVTLSHMKQIVTTTFLNISLGGVTPYSLRQFWSYFIFNSNKEVSETWLLHKKPSLSTTKSVSTGRWPLLIEHTVLFFLLGSFSWPLSLLAGSGEISWSPFDCAKRMEVTIGVMAIGQSAKMLNYPFKVTLKQHIYIIWYNHILQSHIQDIFKYIDNKYLELSKLLLAF